MSVKHTISFNQAIAISIGSIIGWGAYVMPGNLFLPKGELYGSVIALVLGTLCVYVIAFSYIYLLQRTPENRSGGVYWVKYYLNEKHAFIYGWGVAMGYISIIALNLSAIVLLLRYLLPENIRSAVYLYTISGWEVYLSDIVICAGILLFFGIANYRGIKIGAKIQLVIAALMIASVLILFIGSVSRISSDTPYFPTPAEWKNVCAFTWLPILAVMPWAYVGFETTPQLSKNIADSQTKTRHIIIISLLFGFLFYLLIDYFSALNLRFDYPAIARSPWATGEGVKKVLGNTGMVVLATAMLMSILSGINGFMLATYKLLESMIHENILLLGQHDSEHIRHRKIITLICAVCIISPWLGRNYLLDIVNMASLWISIGYLYVVCIAFKVQKKHGRPTLQAYIALLIAGLFLGLLLLPFSPAALAGNAYYLLIVILLSGSFFFYKQFIRR